MMGCRGGDAPRLVARIGGQGAHLASGSTLRDLGRVSASGSTLQPSPQSDALRQAAPVRIERQQARLDAPAPGGDARRGHGRARLSACTGRVLARRLKAGRAGQLYVTCRRSTEPALVVFFRARRRGAVGGAARVVRASSSSVDDHFHVEAP